jgi:hypothetical protein
MVAGGLIMGFFWDLMQEIDLSQQRHKAATLEQRVAQLEQELAKTRQLLHAAFQKLETHLGEDIDQDGKVG